MGKLWYVLVVCVKKLLQKSIALSFLRTIFSDVLVAAMSLSNHDGNGGENVTSKVNSRRFKFITLAPFHIICFKLGNSSGVDSKGLYLSSEKENRLVFSSSRKRETS